MRLKLGKPRIIFVEAITNLPAVDRKQREPTRDITWDAGRQTAITEGANEMELYLNLPVIPNAYAHLYAAGIKFIPHFIDDVQTAWAQVAGNSQLTEERHTSVEAIRTAGFRVPFVDYDPIAEDMQRARDRVTCCPAFQGD